MKVYRLYVAKAILVIYVSILSAWVLAGIGGIIAVLFGVFGPDGPPAWVFAMVLVFGLFNSYMWLRIPFPNQDR